MSSPVRDALSEYLAGRRTADRLVGVIAAAFYREPGHDREVLRPVMDVIERVSPGTVALARSQETPGFSVRLAERSFPGEYEAMLRTAAERTLTELASAAPLSSPSVSPPGLWRRLLAKLRNWFG